MCSFIMWVYMILLIRFFILLFFALAHAKGCDARRELDLTLVLTGLSSLRVLVLGLTTDFDP